MNLTTVKNKKNPIAIIVPNNHRAVQMDLKNQRMVFVEIFRVSNRKLH